MSSLQRYTKIYGAVESESYITFTGFCKKIYETTQQSVEVFIDEKKVETLLANEKISHIEDKYEVFDTNGFCFTYKLPKEYIGQKHKLEFKTQNGEQLLHSPTHTLDKFSPLYNQAMFIESLNQPLKYDFKKEGYTKNALSFIVIEENLSDEAFIEFVLEMCKKHKELSLTLFYFNEHQKNQATKQFKQIKNKQFINPSNVEEIIKSSEIYLHNVIEEFRFTINEEYYNKVKNQSAIKENLFVLELTRKAKKKKDMAEMVVDTVTPILFETSLTSQMFKEDERYNEFVFMNSIGSVDEEKIKDMYCPNSIGFLATKENLEDDEFVGYIKELMVRFPDVEFKGFGFTEDEKIFKSIFGKRINYYVPKKLNDLAINIEIYLLNGNKLYCDNVYTKIRTENIFVIYFSSKYQVMTVREWDSLRNDLKNTLLDNMLKNNFLMPKNVNKFQSLSSLINYLASSYTNVVELNYEMSMYRFYNFLMIEYIIKSKDFKNMLYRFLFK